MVDTELEFFDNLPRSRGAATALLRARDGRLLLVKPTYRSEWSMPGGVIDQGESPLAACRRECAEELGFVPELAGLCCVDWLPPHVSPDHRPATVFVFAGTLADGQFDRIRLPEDELCAATLATPPEIDGYLHTGAARRIAHAHQAALDGHTVYLEYGRPPRWPQ